MIKRFERWTEIGAITFVDYVLWKECQTLLCQNVKGEMKRAAENFGQNKKRYEFGVVKVRAR